jgi:HD-GYP domain-containing protein (c-di-GMP phosphodiesterase class II)
MALLGVTTMISVPRTTDRTGPLFGSGATLVAAVIDAAALTSRAYLALETDAGELVHGSGPRPAGALARTAITAPDGTVLHLEGDLPAERLDTVAALLRQAVETHFELTAARDDLGRSRRELSILFEFSQAVCRVGSVEDVVERFLHDVVRVLDAREGTFLGLDEAAAELSVVCHHGSSDRTVRDFRLPVGQGIAGRVAEDGQPRLVNDTSRDPDYIDGVNPVASIICAPIRVAGRVVGVVSVNDRRGGALFEPAHLHLLSSLVQLGEVGLENARLYEQVRGLLFAVVDGLIKLVEERSPHTAGHSRRVARLSFALGRQLHVAEREREKLYLAALVHDLGVPPPEKAGPDAPSPWSDTPDFDGVADLVHDLPEAAAFAASGRLGLALPGLTDHRERWDGAGRPKGLAGREISLEGRIIAVAHAFDAATHAPLPKDRLSPPLALEELRARAGAAYDPDVVAAFVAVYASARLAGWVPPTEEDRPWQSAVEEPSGR